MCVVLLWKQLDLDLTRLDLNEPSKTSRLDLRLSTWNAVCCSSFKHLNWALFSPGLTGVCQLPAAWSLDDSQPAGSDPVIEPIPQLSNCVALFSPPAKFLRQLSPQSHRRCRTVCLSTIWLSLCLATQLAVVLSDKHRAGGFNDSLGREGLKSYRWVMN